MVALSVPVPGRSPTWAGIRTQLKAAKLRVVVTSATDAALKYVADDPVFVTDTLKTAECPTITGLGF